MKPYCNFFFVLSCYCEARAHIAETFAKEKKSLIEGKFLYFYQEHELHQDKEEEQQRKTTIPKNYILARVGINYIFQRTFHLT